MSFPINKKYRGVLFAAAMLLCIGLKAKTAEATAFTSNATGNFNIGTTWGGACASACTQGTDYPGTSDSFTITSGKVVTVTATPAQSVTGGTINTGGTLTIDNTFGLTISGTLTVTGTGVVTNNGTLTVTTALSGTGTLTQGATGILNLAGSSGITTLTATASGNIVDYTGAAAAVKVIAYDHLTLSGSGTATGAVATIASNLTLSGTVSWTTGANMTVGGNLTVGSGTTLTTGSAFTLGVTGTTSVTGTLANTNLGLKTYTGAVTINSGGSWTNVTNSSVTFGGGFANNSGGTLTMGTGSHTFSATQAIGGSNSITFGGGVTINTTVTVTNNNTATVTITGVLTGATGTSSWTQGANSYLAVSAAILVSGVLDPSASGNTVEYKGSAQTIKVPSTNYVNLLISGTNAISTTVTIAGTLTVTGTGSFIPGAGTLTFNNGAAISNSGTMTLFNVTVAASAAVSTTSSFSIAGSLAVGASGTFTSTTGTVTFTGTGKTITGTAAIANMAVTVSVTNTNTLTVGTALSGGGALTNAATAILNIGGTATITTLTANTAGNTVDYTGAGQAIKVTAYSILLLSGSGTVTGAVATIGSNLTLSGTVSWTTGANMTVGGILTIDSGNILTTGSAFTLGVTGATSVTGTLANTNLGLKTYTGAVTINSGGSWTNVTNSSVTFGGGFTNNSGGTLTMGTGSHTFSATQAIGGSNSITFGWTVAINTGFTVTNNNTATVTIAGALTGGSAASTWAQGADSHVIFGAAVLATGTLTATASPNTVEYSGAAQAIKVTVYDHLTLSGSGAPTGAVTTINSDLTTSGTVNWTTGANLTVAGNLTINAGTLTTGANFTLGVIGATSVTGTLANTNTGLKTYTGAVTINSGGSWTNVTNSSVTFGGGFINNSGGTLTMGTGSHTFSGNQAIDGTNSITFGGAVTVNVSTTVTNLNNGTVTIDGTLTLTGNWTQGASSTLVLAGATAGAGTLGANANPNTVTYTGNGATVICSAPGYYDLNLTPAGASAQVLCSGGGQTLSVADDLVLGDGTNAGATGATNNPTLTIGNNLTVSAKATMTATSSAMTIGGAFTNSGNFSFKGTEPLTETPTNIAGSSVTYTATSGIAPILSTWTYRNLIFNGTGGTFSTNQALSVAENLTMTAGTLSVAGSTLTFTGTVTQRIDSQGATYGVLADSNTTAGGVIFASNFTAAALFVNGAGLASATTIQFNAGGLFAIGSLELTGAAGHLVALRSTTNGTRWQLNNTGTNSVTFVDAKDSDARLGITIQANDDTCTNSTNNLNWFFGSSCATVTSTQSGNWSNSSVWDLGFVPTSCNSATIASGHTITLDATNSVSAVTLALPTVANALSIASGQTLTITNALTFTTNTTANAETVTLNGTGNLSAGSIVTTAPTSTGGSLITCANLATGTLTVSGDIALVGNSTAAGATKIDFGTTSTACNVTAGTVHLTGGSTAAALLKLGTGVLTLNGTLTGAGTVANAQLTTSGAATIVLNNGTIGTGETLAIAAGTNLTSVNTSTLTYATAVVNWGALTVNNGTFSDAGAAGTFTSIIIDSATLNANTFLLTNTGNYTNNGVHSGSGGMIMSGTNAVLDGTGTYANTGSLTLNTAAKSFAATANLTIAGTLALTGAFNFTNNGIVTVTSAGGITGSVAGSTWINAAGSTLNVSGPVLAVNGALTATASPNTVNYNGAAQTVKVVTYDSLMLSGSGAKTITGLTTINSTFTLSGTATATPTANLTVGGDFDITGGVFTTANFTLGVTKNTLIAGTFTHSGTAAVTFTGNLTVNGTLSGAGTGTVTVNGDVTGIGTINLSGDTFEQRVAAAQNFGQTSGSNNWTFKDLTFSNSSVGATPETIATETGGSGGVLVNTLLTVGKAGDTAGATTTLDPGDVVWTSSGTGTVFTANLGFLCDPTTCADNTSLFQYTAAGATVIGASTGYYDLLRDPIFAGAVTDTTPAGAITAYHSFTLNPTKTASAACLTLTLGGNLTVTTGALNLNGTTFGCSILNTSAASHYAVTADSITIAQGPGAGATNNLIANSSVITVTDPGTPLTIGASLATYTYGTSTMRYTGDGATIAALSGSGGTNGYYNLELKPNGSSSQIFGTAGGQTIQVNNNLTVGDGANAGATGATNNPALTVVGNVTIAANAALTATSGLFTVGGSWTNSGTFNANASTVTFNGAAAGQTITSNGSAFANIQINGSAASGWTLADAMTVSSTITLTQGTLDTGSNNTIGLSGGWNEAPVFTFNPNLSTVTFTGATAQNINSGGETFAFLVDSNTSAGGVIFPSSFSATGFFINSAGLASPTTVYFNAGSTYTITNITWIGSNGNRVALRSRTPGSQWTLNNTSTNTVTYSDARDSDAHNGQTIIAGAQSTDNGNNVNWTFLILGVSFSPHGYGFGTVNLTATTVSTSAITVTNLGNGTETYSLSVSTTLGTAWIVGTSTPTSLDHFAMFGLFNSVLASSSTFKIQDIITGTPTTASGSVYAGDQTGVSTPVSSTRDFWMRLDMPLTTSTTAQMGMTVTVTASSP